MTNLKPVRVKVVQGEAISPHEFIPCDCAACRESQESGVCRDLRARTDRD